MRRNTPSPEEILLRHCDVCFVPYDREPARELQEGLDVLYCARCDLSVHKCCYDFEPSLTVLSKRVSEFLCEKCRADLPKPPACLVCYGTDGAIKPLQNSSDFIHVYCGLVHNQIDVLSYFPSLSFRKAPHYEELSNICEICMKRNAHDNCAEDSCRRKVHTYCAKRTYVQMAAQSEQPHSWNHHISTGNHGNFDLSDEVIPFELLSEQVDSTIKPLLDLPIDLTLLQQIKQKVHMEYTNQLRSKRKTTKKLRRGGFSYVLCTVHQSTPYCICQSKEQGQMVLCDCCFEWFHYKCINFDPGQAEQRFVCQYCRVFYEFKKKAIDQVRGGRTDADLNRVELPLKISISDCIWVLRVLDNRIRGGQAAKILRELSKYPLKSSCMQLLIRQVSRNRLTGLAQECLGQLGSKDLAASLRPKTVLGLEPSGRPVVLLANVEYNKRVRLAVDCVVGLGWEWDLSAIQNQLSFKEKALTDQYEQIIELCNTQQPYEQVTILKQKAQAHRYLSLAQQLQTQQIVNFNCLVGTETQIANNPEVPGYIVELVSERLKKVSPGVARLRTAIREEPDNLAKINAMANDLEQLKLQPIQEYLQLKTQRKFIQELQLYYTKHTGAELQDMPTRDLIETLLAWSSPKASSELLEILQSYKPVQPCPVWPGTAKLLQTLNASALQFQVREVLRRRMLKQERLFSLPLSPEQLSLQLLSEEAKTFIQQCRSLRAKLGQALSLSLEAADTYEDISEGQRIVQTAAEELQLLPVRIEDESKTPLTLQLKIKKDELDQLMVLFTEAQLPKNPLTINRLLPSLPRANPLVKQYLALKKEHQVLLSRCSSHFAKVSQRIEVFKTDGKKQRKDQIRENSEKPSLGEIKELIETIKQSPLELNRELKELSRMLSNSLEIASKVRRYVEENQDFSKVTSDGLSIRKKEIEELRRKVLIQAQLSLKAELTDLYHLQISLRMRTAILTPNIELDKINFLLKVAEEEAMTHDSLYLQLKERFETKNQKSKEVNQLKHFEQLLSSEAARDTSPSFTMLANYRRSLTLPEASEAKIKNSYVEEQVEKNKTLRNKLASILSGKVKLELQEARPVYLQALKSPFAVPELNKLTPQMNKAYDLFRRWKDLNKNYTISHPIFHDYQQLLFSIQEIQKVRKQLRTNEEEISHLRFLVQSFSAETADQMEGILDRMEGNILIKETEACLNGQQQYLSYWLKFIQHSEKNSELLAYEKLRKLALDAYNLLQRTLKRGDDFHTLVPIITEVEKHLEQVKKHLKIYPKQYPGCSIVSDFIELEDFYFENEDETDISELVPLLKPFEDLPKFRVRNLTRFETKREDLPLRRSHSRLEELRGESQRVIQLPLSSDEEDNVPQGVSDNERRKIKQIFLKNIRKNAELARYGDCENEVKMIENQIFGEWHNDIVKYFEMSDSFEKLLIKLVHCPQISAKLAKKKFEFKFMQLLVNNLAKVEELEQMMVAKSKQEEQEEKQKEPEPAPAAPLPQNAPQSLEVAREDLKKEMKLLKESRQGRDHRHKKKKHHKHHKEHSRSPQAKFSSESEQELPKYIENEYVPDENKSTHKPDPRPSDSPLRYDPEEEEMAKKTQVFPKGSIICLRSCVAEVHTRRLGRVEFGVDLLTEEEHRRVLQAVDPGFSKLSIYKYKNESEMLPYIGKSRKKYRLLVGWFQASHPDQNELLRDLAEEAAEKKKVFGWQNQHIKIHMMSVKQMATIPGIPAPAKVTTPQAADLLNEHRLVFVVQFPERLYEIRDLYKPFEGVTCRSTEFAVSLPLPLPPQPYSYAPLPSIPLIPPVKPLVKEPETVYQGWPVEASSMPLPLAPALPQSLQPGLPSKVNQLRSALGFGMFSPIDSQEEDLGAQEKEENEDLAASLLNSFDVGKVAPPAPREDKPQQYNYYDNYAYQQQRPMPVDGRWMGNYPQPQQQNVYNPLNPMTGRPTGSLPTNPMQMGQPMYRNPLMGQQRPQLGQYYDPRYHQGYPPQ